MISKADIYKALSDLISSNYDWLSNDVNKAKAIHYIFGMNDMARYIAEKMNEQEDNQ